MRGNLTILAFFAEKTDENLETEVQIEENADGRTAPPNGEVARTAGTHLEETEMKNKEVSEDLAFFAEKTDEKLKNIGDDEICEKMALFNKNWSNLQNYGDNDNNSKQTADIPFPLNKIKIPKCKMADRHSKRPFPTKKEFEEKAREKARAKAELRLVKANKIRKSLGIPMESTSFEIQGLQKVRILLTKKPSRSST